ncbi:MAG: hypothetical protein A2W35_16885 [Chloroflexi bacterium RBG_16_57_11]|nr:MAG: hypothetical protein A2W35_16885 [Chloroflexi bacterium RBG_16_57_11]
MFEIEFMWVEIIFNITYLIVLWGLVIALLVRRGELAPAQRRLSDWITAAFTLLALGDTGHVGLRVWAYALGGLESQINLLGCSIGLVGAGALMTAVTVPLFYLLMLEVWRLRFHKVYGSFEYFLLIVGATRLYMLTLSVNEWWRVMPEQPWSTIRNIPLMILGLGVAYLILRDAIASHDATFRWIGISILVSYACYIPVILFVQQAPMLGMLMIPKTLAYLAIGFLAYFDLHKPKKRSASNSNHARKDQPGKAV